MVVCKFFQEGYCRYGQNCRFEHVYGSKYSYHANAPASQPPKQASGGVTDEQLVQQVHNDVQSVLKGGQWLLSCYAPFKKPNFPGLTDLSADEARLFIYEAKANNTLDQAVAYMNNLTKEARSKYEQLLNCSPHILRSLCNGETVSSPFTTNQTPQNVFGQNNASSVFRSAVQDTAKSIFSQASQNVFGSPPAQNQNIFGAPSQGHSPFGAQAQNQSPFGTQTSVFGTQNTAQSIFAQANSPVDPAKSLFAQANSPSIPAKSPFAQITSSPDPAKSLFAQATANQSPFGSAPATSTPFKSPFEQPSPFAQNTGNAFQTAQTPANIFGQTANVFQQPLSDDPAVYSNINDISPEDLEMFKADSFKLGFIPEIPPPHSLCV